MTNWFRPHLCSELNDPDGHVTDCAWCSGVMLADAMTGGKYPSTLAEAEALEDAAGGPFPGGSPSLVLQGMKKRYALTPGLATSPDGLMAQAKPGTAMVVSGLYGNLPAGYQRWSPKFVGPDSHHEAFFLAETASSGWWIDPLGVGGTGYAGEGMTFATLAGFAKGGLGGLFAPAKVLAAPDPQSYVHTVRITGNPGLNMHATPHQSAGVLVWIPKGTTVPTKQLLVHGERYTVGLTARTDWLQVTYSGKTGWVKRGYSALVS